MEQSTLSIHCNLNEWRCNILRKYMHIKHEESRMDAPQKKNHFNKVACATVPATSSVTLRTALQSKAKC